jgi:putative transcriptional regulator
MELRVLPGTLLAASPELVDPNFMHAVVLMVQHGEEGAYGLVMNRRSPFTVGELLPGHPRLEGSGFPVHWGGPVGNDSMQVLHRDPEHIPGGMPLAGDLYLGGELEAVARYLQAEPERAARRLRFLLGYSGWGEGQLERELAQESWLPATMKVALLFEEPIENAWRRVVQSVGGDARGFEHLPPDPSWN